MRKPRPSPTVSALRSRSGVLRPVSPKRRPPAPSTTGKTNSRSSSTRSCSSSVLLAVVEAEKPPSHLILGSDALRLVADARATFDAETYAWTGLSKSTDYPDGEQIA